MATILEKQHAVCAERLRELRSAWGMREGTFGDIRQYSATLALPPMGLVCLSVWQNVWLPSGTPLPSKGSGHLQVVGMKSINVMR